MKSFVKNGRLGASQVLSCQLVERGFGKNLSNYTLLLGSACIVGLAPYESP